ncbi:hypothetical protein KZY93_004248 [Vibrio vulnificus]|nr:hypothetical protein [Vibrio vulnificus]
MNKRLINIILRGATISSKFLFLFYLASSNNNVVLGEYGLISAIIMFLVIFFGFEFHTFSNRELIKSRVNGDAETTVLKQFSLYHMVYLLSVPLVFVAAFFVDKKWIIVLSMLLLISEHYSLEMSRVLIACGKQVKSSVLMLLRGALWMLPLVVTTHHITIQEILVCWFALSVLSCLLGCYWLKEEGCYIVGFDFDLKYYMKGIHTSIIFFISSIFITLVSVVDRYFVESFFGSEDLSIYVFYVGIAGSITSLFDAGIAVFLYPALIKNKIENNHKAWKVMILKSNVIVVLFSIVLLATVSLIFGYKIFSFDESYSKHTVSLYVLIAAFTIKTISSTYQYALYSLGKDINIVVTNAIPISIIATSIIFFIITDNAVLSLEEFCFIILLSYIVQFFCRYYMIFKCEKGGFR